MNHYCCMGYLDVRTIVIEISNWRQAIKTNQRSSLKKFSDPETTFLTLNKKIVYPRKVSVKFCCPMQRMAHSSAAIYAASSTCRSTPSWSNKSCNLLPFMMACLRASFHEMSKWSPLLGGCRPLETIWPKYRERKAHALLPFLLSRVDWLKLSGNDHSVATVDSYERWPVKIASGIEGDNTVTLADLQCKSRSWCHISLIRKFVQWLKHLQVLSVNHGIRDLLCE